MQLIQKNLKSSIDIMQEKFGSSADFYAKELCISGIPCAVFLFDGISSSEKLWEMFLSRLSRSTRTFWQGSQLFDYVMKKSSFTVEKNPCVDFESLTEKLTSGFAALLIEGCDKAILFSVQNMKHRAVDSPSGEGNVRGSQEGFADLLRVNISLLRRLVRTADLTIEIDSCGLATNTEYAICYHKSLVSSEILAQAKKHLNAVSLPFLFDSAYFSSFLTQKSGVFRAVGYTERPVTACAKICEGKIVVLVNGSPFALIYPYFFAENFETLDDYAFPAYFSGITRILRYFAFLSAIMLPGLYVMVVGFTPEIVPVSFLNKLLASESEALFSPLCQMICAILVLELIRIADLRMPKSAGHSVSLVAALIVGESAVKAGLLSAALLICVAISSVSMYALPKLYEQIILLRFLFLFSCGIFGPAGLAGTAFFLLASMARADSGGLNYLSPLWPPQAATVRDGFIRKSWKKLNNHYFSIQNWNPKGTHYE